MQPLQKTVLDLVLSYNVELDRLATHAITLRERARLPRLYPDALRLQACKLDSYCTSRSWDKIRYGVKHRTKLYRKTDENYNQRNAEKDGNAQRRKAEERKSLEARR